MLPKKFLVGGTAAVGSVATAAVVGVGQNGLSFNSTSKVAEPQIETQSKTKQDKAINNPTEAEKARKAKEERERNIVRNAEETSRQQKAKEQDIKGVEKWLSDNQGKNNWQIKVKYGEEINDFKISDPTGLPAYLNSNTTLLKSIAGEKTVFTFDSNVSNNKQNWKNIFTAEQINAWVKNTSGDKATLKVENLQSLNSWELEKLLNSLSSENNKNLFTNLGEDVDVNNKKTILFEKIESDWKHSKTEINKWLSGDGENKFTFLIEKNSKTNPLETTDEDNLIDLFKYLKDNKTQLLKYKNPTEEKMTLTLKKENGWDIVHNKTTMDNWIVNTFGKKENLKLYEGNNEKNLPSDENELKKIFSDLNTKDNLDLFRKFLEKEEDQKVIVFEKYNGTWTHIKKAIENWIDNQSDDDDVPLPRIEIGGSSQALITNDRVKDIELIGLLGHIQCHKGEYGTEGFLVLKKNDKNEWQKIKYEESKKI